MFMNNGRFSKFDRRSLLHLRLRRNKWLNSQRAADQQLKIIGMWGDEIRIRDSKIGGKISKTLENFVVDEAEKIEEDDEKGIEYMDDRW